MEWNDEAIIRLRDFWAQGLSTAEIGRRMGISKNAVVGKAHRLTLAARPSPIRRNGGAEPRPATARRIVGPTLPPLLDHRPKQAIAAGAGDFVTRDGVAPHAAYPQARSAPAMPNPRPAEMARAVAPSAARGEPARTHPPASPVTRPTPSGSGPSGPPPERQPPSRPVAVRSAPFRSSRVASCCWPIGEPGTKSFCFCSADAVSGKPYCQEHVQRAYVKLRDRRDEAAA